MLSSYSIESTLFTCDQHTSYVFLRKRAILAFCSFLENTLLSIEGTNSKNAQNIVHIYSLVFKHRNCKPSVRMRTARVIVVVVCVCMCVCMCVCVTTHNCRLTHWNHKNRDTNVFTAIQRSFKILPIFLKMLRSKVLA